MEEHETQNSSQEESGGAEETSDDDGGSPMGFGHAAVGGVVAALFTGGAKLAVGSIGAWEAQNLLQAMIPTTRFLCSAMMTASATILALLLTLLSISSGSETKLRPNFFKRVKVLAMIDTAGFIASTVVLLMLIMPLGQSEEISGEAFTILYYAVLTVSALIGGLFVTIILMLYSTITDAVSVVALDDEDHRSYRSEYGE